MSDNIPLEIQAEIIKRIPVKSLLQFRSVSKAWKSLIDSSDFINRYSSQQQHLLVRYNHRQIFPFSERKYVSIVDDETFPHQRVSLTHPAFVNMLRSHRIIGNSHGLLCLYGCYGLETTMAVVWNVSIRKAIAVVVPNVANGVYTTFVGFGVCPATNDPKIVKITDIIHWEDVESIPDSIPWQVEVFTLSTGHGEVHITIFLVRQFNLVVRKSIVDAGFEGYNRIISFHLTSEEFREVNLPDRLVYDGCFDNLNIANLRESLVVLEQDARENVCYVWSMKDGVSVSFTKLYTIYSPNATLLRVLEFRKNGEPLIEIEDIDDDRIDIPSLLAVYKPKSKHISNIGINGAGSFYVYSYMETLLLLDQQEFTIFDKGKSYIARRRAEIRSLLKHISMVQNINQ
ncbi:putative F-box domain-containing protein [Helianthus annuus]|nr:putative F-box domain-containing protein [Helianthus annuus]